MSWISVKESLPDHHQTVLAYCPTGQGVCVFVDSEKMNETLRENGYGHEAVDISKNPYYFCSQEIKRHTLNGVTHWMPLPEPPK